MPGMRFRTAFEPGKPLICLRPLKVGYRTTQMDEPFPTEGFTERRLRQLYDQRALGYADEDPKSRFWPPNPSRPGAHTILKPPPPPPPPPPPFIPSDWKTAPPKEMRRIANQFSRVPIHNRLEAEDAIEAELARRARLKLAA